MIKRPSHKICLVAALAVMIGLPCVLHAEFPKKIRDSIKSLHKEIIFRGQRNINGADTAAMWGLFDADVLQSLNGGVLPLTVANLNAKYNWTDIKIPLADAGEKGDMKTGAIRIQFFQLGQNSNEKPTILAVYYHGLGVVPASTFRIFKFADGRYVIQAAMEKTPFINQNPELQWNAIQIQMEKEKGHFSTYFNPAGSNINRKQVLWNYDGKKLKAIRWYPEVDYHFKGDKIVPGRGNSVKF